MITITRNLDNGKTAAVSFDPTNRSHEEIMAMAEIAIASLDRQFRIVALDLKVICGGACTDAGH